MPIELLSPREDKIQKTDPGDVPKSMLWLGSGFETPFLISAGQTDQH